MYLDLSKHLKWREYHVRCTSVDVVQRRVGPFMPQRNRVELTVTMQMLYSRDEIESLRGHCSFHFTMLKWGRQKSLPGSRLVLPLFQIISHFSFFRYIDSLYILKNQNERRRSSDQQHRYQLLKMSWVYRLLGHKLAELQFRRRLGQSKPPKVRLFLHNNFSLK